MNKKKIFITIIISGVAFGINYLINFFLTPFITENIGTEAYGYVNLAKTIASYAVIMTAALNSYATRYIAIAYHEKNFEKTNQYFNSVLFSNIFIGILLIVSCVFFLFFIPNPLNAPSVLIKDVSVLLVLVFSNLFLSLSNTALQAASIIQDKLTVVSIFKGVSYCVEAISLLCMYAVFKPRVYFIGIGLICATLVLSISNFIMTRKYTPELKISFKFFDIVSVKKLVLNGIWNSLNSLGNMLNSGLDLMISNILLGGVVLGQVSIVKTFTSIFSVLFQMVAQPFQPSLIKLYADNEMEKLVDVLRFSMKISGMVSNLAFAGIVGLGLNYYDLWIPNQNTELLYRLTIIAVTSSILEGAICPLYYIYTLTVKNKIPCIITIMGGISNVLGMCFLIQYTSMGIYAIFVTTAVIMLIINGITNPVYMTKCLKLPWYTFYPTLGRHVLSCVVMSISFYFFVRALNPTSWIEFLEILFFVVGIGIIEHLFIVFDVKDLIEYLKKIVTK